MAYVIPAITSDGNTMSASTWAADVNETLEHIDPKTRGAVEDQIVVHQGGEYTYSFYTMADALRAQYVNSNDYALAWLGARPGKLEDENYVHGEEIGIGWQAFVGVGNGDIPGSSVASGRWAFRGVTEDDQVGVIGPWFTGQNHMHMYGDISMAVETGSNFVFGFMDWPAGANFDFHFSGPSVGYWFAMDGRGILYAMSKDDGGVLALTDLGIINSESQLLRLHLYFQAGTNRALFYVNDELLHTREASIPISTTPLRAAAGMRVFTPNGRTVGWNLYSDLIAYTPIVTDVG